MFEKVLIATDFSPASDTLIDCAAQLKPFGVKQAVLVHVVCTAYTRGIEDAHSKRLEEMFKAQATAHLAPQKKRLEEQGIEVETVLDSGIPARDLNLIADRYDVSAILIGSRGHGLVKKAALGSVSFRLLQTARRPVFLSRSHGPGEGEEEGRAGRCGQLFSKILFATDFSDASEQAFGYVEGLAREFKSDITLIHVFGRSYKEIPLTASGMKKQDDIERRRIEKKKARLEQMKEQLEALGSRVAIDWKTGEPAKEIVSKCAEGHFTLTVMGNHGVGFFREALLGSVANDVARRAEVPVLLIPSSHAAAEGTNPGS